jgi:hypothetical protein
VDFSGADLQAAILVNANLEYANLTGCRVQGISVWCANLNCAEQQNLIITAVTEPEITVDNIEVAQFVYLLLRNEKIRDVIDTITSKVVLDASRMSVRRSSTRFVRSYATVTKAVPGRFESGRDSQGTVHGRVFVLILLCGGWGCRRPVPMSYENA